MAFQDQVAPSLWSKQRLKLSGGETKNTIGISLNRFHTVKYIISIWNDDEQKTKSLELTVNRSGAVTRSIVSAREGVFRIGFNDVVSSNQMSLEVINSETFDAQIDLAYIVLG